jgi:hypothetical membrane protein
MKTKALLFSGILSSLIFWLTLFVSSHIQGDYDHASDLVSYLGTIGTSSEYVFMTGMFICVALSILFVIGLYKVCKTKGLNILPAIFILAYSFSLAGAALFPLPLRLHGILGTPSILILLSPILAFFLWNDKRINGIKIFSVIILLIMCLGFLTFMPDIMGDYPGLKQRFFHMGWSMWFVYLSFAFIKMKNRHEA